MAFERRSPWSTCQYEGSGDANTSTKCMPIREIEYPEIDHLGAKKGAENC